MAAVISNLATPRPDSPLERRGWPPRAPPERRGWPPRAGPQERWGRPTGVLPQERPSSEKVDSTRVLSWRTPCSAPHRRARWPPAAPLSSPVPARRDGPVPGSDTRRGGRAPSGDAQRGGCAPGGEVRGKQRPGAGDELPRATSGAHGELSLGETRAGRRCAPRVVASSPPMVACFGDLGVFFIFLILVRSLWLIFASSGASGKICYQ